MLFSKEDLRELSWDSESHTGLVVVERNFVESNRWSLLYELVFKFDGKFYMTGYSVGATEQQDERPFEYEPEQIECPEVRPVQVLTTVYKPV